MHPRLNGIPVVLADGQQLQYISHFPAEADVLAVDLRNAFPVNVFHVHPAVEPDGSQDAQLVLRVHAFHVRRWIRLRQAQPLGVLQNIGVFGALRRHPGQDVVGRAVHDAHNLLNVVGNQRALNRVDNRNRPAHAGFVVKPRAGLPGHGPKLVEVQAQRHLVRRHDALAVLQRPQHHASRRLLPAQEFADDLNLRVFKDVVLIGRQHLVRHFLAAVNLLVQHQRLFHPHLHAGPLRRFVAEFANQIPNAASDVPESQQSQHNLFHFPFPPRFFSLHDSVHRSTAAPSGSAVRPACRSPCSRRRSSGPCPPSPRRVLPRPVPA